MKQIPQAGPAVTLTPVLILREALQHSLDELNRINAAHNCVRPDVTYAAAKALRDTDLPPIPHASEIEKRIVGKLVEALLAAGYTIGVNDGEDDVVSPNCNDAEIIYKALASTDADILLVRNPGTGLKSFVALVWGNDAEIISDYGISLDAIIEPISDWAEAQR